MISIERRAQLALEVGSIPSFTTVVRALFAQRRKMARRALKAIVKDPESLLHTAGLDSTMRGERFTLEELAMLSRTYHQLQPLKTKENRTN